MKKANQKNALKAPAPDKQKTLLQFWPGKSDKNSSAISSGNNPKSNKESAYFKKPGSIDQCQNLIEESKNELALIQNQLHEIDEEDDDDMELIKASDTYFNMEENSLNSESHLEDQSKDDCGLDKLSTGIDNQMIQTTQFFDTTGFDHNSGSVWIYPNNMPIRNYQFTIVEQCLFKNTMVVLPTGLGKTLIASVVMFNFYRWYPLGKVVFMAPTKPLVNQQLDACYNIVGVSKDDMIQMTGQMAPDKRKILWNTKRIFFLTPQVLSNDILRGIIDVDLIKCVVIDEAHKALGDYAFCKVKS